MMLELKTTKEMLIQCAVYCSILPNGVGFFFFNQCRVGLKNPEKSVCFDQFFLSMFSEKLESKENRQYFVCKMLVQDKWFTDEILVVGI